MKKLAIILPILGILFNITSCSKRTLGDGKSTVTKNLDFDIFLFIGQSNMGGVGPIGVLDTVTLNHVLLFTNEKKWEKAKNELGVYGGINRYSTSSVKGKAQLSPSYTCLRKIATLTGKTIGAVSNARGGTRIEWWQKGYSGEKDYDLYENAVAQAKAAVASRPNAKIKGIIWHQGEGNNSTTGAATYMKNLKALVADLRKDLGDASIPFIAGEVGKWEGRGTKVNPVIRQIKENISNTDWVSSDGLTSINLPKNDPHFDTYSQRILGERYADKALEMIYNIAPEGVMVYNEKNYEGRSVLLHEGNYSKIEMESMGLELKEIASIKPSKGYMIKLVSAEGKTEDFKGNSADFKSRDDIVELKVVKL